MKTTYEISVSWAWTNTPGTVCLQKTETEYLLSMQRSIRIESSLEKSSYYLRNSSIVAPYSTVRQASVLRLLSVWKGAKHSAVHSTKRPFGSLTNGHIACRIEEERRKGRTRNGRY